MATNNEHPLQKLLDALPSTPVLSALGLTPEALNKLLTKPHARPKEKPEEEFYIDSAVAPIGHTRPPAKLVTRAFGFLDMVSFTETIATLDADEAVALLTVFRTLIREVAAARGCRIEKWLGDGVLIVSSDRGALAATLVELNKKLNDADIPVSSGVTYGEVILLEGDQHIGTAVNLASRLSDAARPGEVLCSREVLDGLPVWIVPGKMRSLRLKGLGKQEAHELLIRDI